MPAIQEPILFKLEANGFVFETSSLKDGIKWGKQATFTQTPIMNRSSPIITYANSAPTILSVGFDLVAMEDGDQVDLMYVMDSVMSLTFPNDPGIEPPTLCYITLFGESKVSSIFNQWPCVVPSVDCQVGQHQIWTKDGAPMSGSCTLQFLGVELQNHSAKEYLQAGNYKQLAYRNNQGFVG